jgi:hypothetical protein
MGPHYRQVYEQANLNFQLFETVDQAQVWVAESLAKV